jgi:hypothetical protein
MLCLPLPGELLPGGPPRRHGLQLRCLCSAFLLQDSRRVVPGWACPMPEAGGSPSGSLAPCTRFSSSGRGPSVLGSAR